MLDNRRRSLLALLRPREADRSLVSSAARSGSLDSLFADPAPVWASGSLLDIGSPAGSSLDALRAEVDEILTEARKRDIDVVTMLDDAYPENLRALKAPPPFLFYRGDLRSSDVRACAVVGTRQPSPIGRGLAERWTEVLVRRGLVIVSGLAKGIDTCAHETAIACGGRTIAVLGFGFDHMYPKENAELASRIPDHGAVVSQFWPDTAPSRKTFPIRNTVSSGLSLGTAVIEASHTSGARMQARVALEQHRAVMFPPELVASQAWARQFLDRGARVVDIDRVDIEQRDDDELTSGAGFSEHRAGEPPVGDNRPLRLFSVVTGHMP